MALDASYNTLNYQAQGGSVWVIGGVLDFEGAGVIQVAGVQATDLGAFVDNTGGAPSLTFAAITAGAGYAQADMVAVKNALAEIALWLNSLRTTIRSIGLTT